MAKWGHTFKVSIIIIIKTPFCLLKINKRTNKKYLRDSDFEMHFIIMKAVSMPHDNFFDILLVFF